MEKPLPPEVVQQIIDLAYYFIAAAVGWIGKWLSGKKLSSSKNSTK